VGRAMRSRPRLAPYGFQASSEVSTWFGTPEPRLPLDRPQALRR
jgi:hypothetical protein